jgi:hypothetical protein
MKVKVHLLAFGQPNEVRYVEVEAPASEEQALLDQVFHFGQNDFQPQRHPSVSMGDVVELENSKFYVIQAVGFKELSRVEFVQYRALERRERVFSNFVE